MTTLQFIPKKIVKQIPTFILAASLWLGSSTIAYSQKITEFDSQYSYYYNTLSSKKKAYFKYKVPAYTFGVFTLKNNSGKSDFDISAYKYDGDWQLIDKQNTTGTQTELIIVQPSNIDRYIYLEIVNYGSVSSEYRFYADHVSPFNKFLLAAAKALITSGFDAEENISERDASRIVTGILSLFEGNGLTGVTKDLVINEVTAEMREQFGYGAMGDFIVDWSVSIVSGFYKNYP